jgi:hypothetical protein
MDVLIEINSWVGIKRNCFGFDGGEMPVNGKEQDRVTCE